KNCSSLFHAIAVLFRAAGCNEKVDRLEGYASAFDLGERIEMTITEIASESSQLNTRIDAAHGDILHTLAANEVQRMHTLVEILRTAGRNEEADALEARIKRPPTSR